MTGLLAACFANVIIPRAVERVWFDANDDFIVRFGEEMIYIDDDITDWSYSTSAGTYFFPAEYTPPPCPPFELNLSQLIPEFTIQRGEDHFIVHYDPLEMFDEILYWGPQNDLSVNIHPLTAGQSTVQHWETGYDGMEYYDIRTWVKDIGFESPVLYHPSTRCTLRVHVQDAEGAPVSGVPVYYDFTSAAHPATITPHGYTNAEGFWQKPYYCAVRTQLWINDPQTQAAVVDTLLFPEPGGTIQINAVVSTSAGYDPYVVPSSGVLTLYPSVLRNSSGNTITAKFMSDQPLSRPAELTLCDLRGRVLAHNQMPVSGQTEWILPPLANGIYFIGLSSGGRQLARQRITVLK